MRGVILIPALFLFGHHAKAKKTLNADCAFSAGFVLNTYIKDNPMEQYEVQEIAQVYADLKALEAAPLVEDKALQKKTDDDLTTLHQKDNFLQTGAGHLNAS